MQLTVKNTATPTAALQSQRRAEDASACVARFRVMHEAAKGSVMALKLAKFFAGIEVQTLCDIHDEEHGETRGRPAASEINDTPLSLISAGEFLEDSLGVTKRTAYRYRAHFVSCTQDKPELAEKLRKWWLKWKDEAALSLPAAEVGTKKGTKKGTGQLVTTAAHTLALHEVCNLAAKDMQDLLDHADAWGLHELFEKPVKDVTPPSDEADDDGRDDAKERLAKFWLKDFSRRALNHEYLKLRKQDREALLTTWEEATNKLKDSLKGGKK